MADKLQGTWVFDKVTTASPVSPPTSKDFGVNFISNGVEFQKLSIRNAEDVTTSKTYRLTYEWDTTIDGSSGIRAFDYGAWNEAYKTIEITSKYDEVEDAETLVQALSARASFIPAWGDIEIVMTSAKGVLLKTLDKFCKNDILVTPDLEDVVIGENGEYTSDKVGYGKVTVNVTSLGDTIPADKYFEGGYAEVELPNATKIKQGAFDGDSYLVQISMPKVTEIGAGAFRNCSKLAITSLPSGLTSIASNAFYGCKKLALTSLPSGVGSINYQAFYNCTNLALTSLPEGIYPDIGQGGFCNCTNLALTSLPEVVTRILQEAFYGCTNLALTSLPSGLTYIGKKAFQNCTNLALTSLPEGIGVDDYAFYGCKKLALTSLPNDFKGINGYAFQNCTNLALTSLPSSITYIRTYGFSGCSALNITEIPSGVTTLGTYCFHACTNLTSITFKGTPTSLAVNAFISCTNLTTINVPWAEGAISGAPWGATNATINYNYTGG